MAVKDINERYKCNICGNEVMVTKVGGGTLICCGEEMELVEPKKDKKSLLEEGFEIEDGEEEEDYKEDMEDENKEEEEI